MNDGMKLCGVDRFRKEFMYRTEEGDTLFSVAEKFHTTRRILIAVNNLTEEPVAGMLILVSQAKGDRYVVRPGDNFFSLAGGDRDRAFALMNKNKTDELYVGQVIYL